MYRFYRGRKISGSVFGAGGVALGNFAGGIKGFSPDYVGLWSTTLRPAFTVGVNFDYNFFPNLAGRITPTYIGTTFDGAPQPSGVQTVHGSLQNNLGINLRHCVPLRSSALGSGSRLSLLAAARRRSRSLAVSARWQSRQSVRRLSRSHWLSAFGDRCDVVGVPEVCAARRSSPDHKDAGRPHARRPARVSAR